MTKTIKSLSFLTLATSAILFTGCSPKQEAKADETLADAKAATAETWEKTKDVSKETWASIAAATYDQRQSFKAGVSNLAKTIDSKTDKLAAKSDTLSNDAAAKWEDGVDNLKEARAELSHELDQLGDATADTWDDAKGRVAAAWDKVQNAYNNLEARMTS